MIFTTSIDGTILISVREENFPHKTIVILDHHNNVQNYFLADLINDIKLDLDPDSSVVLTLRAKLVGHNLHDDSEPIIITKKTNVQELDNQTVSVSWDSDKDTLISKRERFSLKIS